MTITIPGYKIEQLIAEGGMATVYLAIQESLGRHVAIKLLKKFDNPEQSKRFLNEGQIIASLNHRNVINIYDVGVTDDGRPYISMEYLEGGDLDARIRNEVDAEDALQWLETIGNCLDFVHQKGIIHRDIKPGNILFHKDGTPILSDFGIAKQEEKDATLTMEGLAYGSPYYISPEQAASKELDKRTDIYSLGIVLYEMLTGSKPYKGDSHIETIIAHLSDPLPDLPPELHRYHTLINKMVAKSPDDRFSSAAEMVHHIQQLRKPVKKPLRKAWISAGAVAIILGVGGAFFFMQQSVILDRNEHQTTQDTTISNAVIHNNSPNIVEAPLKESDNLARETPAIPGSNDHQTASDISISEEAISEPPPNNIETPSQESDDLAREHPDPSDTNEQRIESLLSQAAIAIKEYRLTTPKNNNAYYYFQRILELHPEHEKALEGITGIADAYADLAESKLDKFDYEAANKHLQRGLMIQPSNKRLQELQEYANVERILSQATTAFKEYRLTTPKNDNAYYYYQRVLELRPKHEKALEGITGIADAYADLVESKLDQFEYEAARKYLHRGLTIQPSNKRLQALQKDTNAFRDAPGRIWKKIKSPFS